MSLGEEKQFWVYMLVSKRNGTIYIGSTDNLGNRIWQHKEEIFGGFTAKHNVKLLVWCEPHQTRESAFSRERQMKKWKRSWKIELIEKENPNWVDLYEEMCG